MRKTRFYFSLVLAVTVALAHASLAQVVGVPGGPQQPAPIQPLPVLSVSVTGAASLDSIQDINGDGFRDLIVGSPGFDQVTVLSGRNGSTLGVMVGPGSSSFGHDVASTGDVDGDSIEDILIGAPDGAPDGQVYLYSSATFAPLCIWGPSTAGPGSGQLYGWSVSRAGQINGTGPEEILAGMPLYTPAGLSRPGLVEGIDPVTCPTTVLQTVTNGNSWEQFGDSLANLGPVDADAIDDYAVGATRFFAPTGIVCQPQNVPGIVEVYSGVSLNFAAPVLLYQVSGVGPADTFGFAVGSGGDLNVDGIGDLLVGAPDFCGSTGPAVYAYDGPTGSLLYSVATPTDPCLHYGWAVSTIGNFRGANYDEFVVGAPNVFGSCGINGRAFVHNGRNGNLIFTLTVSGASATFGYDVTELTIATRTFAVADRDAGMVHVYDL